MRMKVLIACDRNTYGNPYVSTLADGLENVGCDVTCSIDAFWENDSDYDVVHIQWPNLLARKMGRDGEALRKRLSVYHDKKVPVVVTLHNIMPHYNKKPEYSLAYDIVYENADCFIHLGPASVRELKERRPDIKACHCVIPHHSYDALYNFDLINRDFARMKLKIPKDKTCILCFGSFRDDEERNLLIKLKKKLGTSYYILAPGFYRSTIIRKNVYIGFVNLLKTIKYSCIAKYYDIHIAHTYISNERLPYYLVAADLVFIQRLKILNSGNVPLALHAGMPVVGPDCGNVGWLLKETQNGVFEISHTEKIPYIIESLLKDKDCGVRNRNYAKKFLSTDIVAKQTKELYEKLIERFV